MSAERKSSGKSPPIDSREALLRAAKRVFALKGYEGATVKDLADDAGVNVSLVSYHFGGKEGLYRTALEGFGIERVEAAERLLRAPGSREDFVLRLKLFADDFIEIHHRDQDTCKLLHRGMETLDPVSSEIFKRVFFRIFVALETFIGSAQKCGILKATFDTEVATILMFGSLVHYLRGQEIARLLGKRTLDEPVYRQLVIDQWVSGFTEGIFA